MDKSESVKPFRCTYSIVTKEGIGGLVTLSYDTAQELQDGMTDAETWFALSSYKGKETSYKPQNSTAKAPVPQTPPPSTGMLPNCEKCGTGMVMGRNGKPYCKNCYINWRKSQEQKSY